MKPQFELERNTAVINFSAHYCNTEDELLNSHGFEKVLTRFLKRLKKKEAPVYEQLVYVCGEEHIASELTSLFKLLLVLDIEEIMQMNRSFIVLLQHKDTLIEFIEELYNYWRALERYSVIYNGNEGTGIQKIKFIEANRGNVLVPVLVPNNIDGSKLTALIDERYNYTVAGGMSKYAGKMLRVGIIGEITEKEINLLVEYIKEVLPECKK